MKGAAFELQVPPSDTIQDLKKALLEVKPEWTDEMTLVYTNRILRDSTKLKDAGIKTNYPIVPVLSKKTQGVEPPRVEEQSVEVTQPGDSQIAQHALESEVPEQVEQSIRTPNTHANEVVVRQLCELGFARRDVEQCLHYAHGNPDLAAHLLMRGTQTHSNMQSALDPSAGFAQTFEAVAESNSSQRGEVFRNAMEMPARTTLDHTSAVASNATTETTWEVQTENGWAPFRPRVPFHGQTGERVSFQLGRFAYDVSFQNDRAGIQTNVSTGRQRALRRRLPQHEAGICRREQLPTLLAHELEFAFSPRPDGEPGQTIRSEIKLVGDFQFRLLVFPRGTRSTGGSHVSIFMEASATQDISDKNWMFEKVKYQITLINFIDYRASITKVDTFTFNKDAIDRGWHDFLLATELTSEKGWIGPDGEMLVRASCWCPYARTLRLADDYDPQKELGLLKWTPHEALPTSLLQSLSHIAAFRRLINSSACSSSLQALLQDLLKNVAHRDTSVQICDPGSILQAVGWHGYSDWDGKGPGEFLADLCVGLGIDDVKQLFHCELDNYIECCDVDFKSSRREACYGFKLPLLAPDGQQLGSVVESLRQMFTDELLDGENLYEAEGYGKQRARKGVRLSHLPPVLVLEITRASFDLQKMEPNFLKNTFEFPNDLDLTAFLAGSAPYKLHTVISQNTESGSYNAHIRKEPDSDFVKYLDDGNVVTCTEYSAVTSKFGIPELQLCNYFDQTPEELQTFVAPTRTRDEIACTLVYICGDKQEQVSADSARE